MRIVLLVAVFLLSACSSERLSETPAAGVDLSGHWKLSVADSDDAQRLMQAQLAAATANGGPGGSTSPGGSQRARGGAGFGAGPTGPMMPPVAILDEGLRWPGRDLEIKQTAGTVTFAADGGSRQCRPRDAKGPPLRSAPRSDRSHGRDVESRGRGDAPPPRCGWDGRTLVVQSSEPDEDRPPFDQRFSVSEDAQRLFEVVTFRAGRSNGFTASRVWDRAPAGAQQ